ncbi:MAG TPA: NAD-dependent epimerase/dehydratase family protein [Oleiagrimonas sp.]|nr:NAD-dependent epimerase/dehydratase family protein [Oleiagrimonas sp.]
MNCVVFGGSGQIGGFLLPRLCADQVATTAFSREPRADAGGVSWRQGRLPGAVPSLPDAVTAIVCLGPLDHFTEWLERARISGSPRVVAMSSMSAQSKRDSPVAAERELASRLRSSEQRLLARCRDMGSACTILRATLIYGGTSGSLERLSAKARRWHVFPLLRGRGLRQPVHADDLARAVVAALGRPQGEGIVQIGGGERLQASAMFARARRQLAVHTLGVPLPHGICHLLAGVSGRGRGVVERLGQDLIADNARLIALLGVEPRSFQPQPPASKGVSS